MPVSEAPSRLEQISAVLGEYMLKGWTLTDLHCDVCRTTPLMREPAAAAALEGRDRVQFCALCDGSPSGPIQSSSSSSSARPSIPAPIPSSSNIQSLTQTRSPLPDAQDDAANAISKLLLRGYSLLGTNCPNCRGVPLVGYPKAKDGTKDGRRMCVSCGGRWVEEGRLGELKVVQDGTVAHPGHGDKGKQIAEPDSPRTRRRNELYGLHTATNDITRGRDVDSDPSLPTADDSMEIDQKSPPIKTTNPSLAPTFEKTSSSLALTLDRLAASLAHCNAGQSKDDEARYFVDVKLHTDAMKDVLDVLARVQRLE